MSVKALNRYSPSLNYILLSDDGEPKSYKETLQDENSSKWELAMKDEKNSFIYNHTWELIDFSDGKKALHSKWVYRVKNEHDGNKWYKARLVVKGFEQKFKIDYFEVFSHVKNTTIRLVLGMVASENWHLEQLDVKTTFFHGNLEKEIDMHPQEGFTV